MLVRERMILPGTRIMASLPVRSAIETFERSGALWLPVVDQESHLLGLVTLREVMKAKDALKAVSESEAENIIAQDIMTSKFLFVNENIPVEEAARMMVDYDISELPVVRDGYLTGIITDKIMLRVLLEITGARRQGVRLMVEIENETGELLSLLQQIYELKGSVQGLCTYSAKENEFLIVTMRVVGVDKYVLKQLFQSSGKRVIDIR